MERDLRSRKDIQHLLDDWPYDSEKLCVREIVGTDGKRKIQLRIEMGVLQMETTGRPDGKRPKGYDSLLDYYKARARTDSSFSLDGETCIALQMEALQYYHRRIGFLELGEYEKARKDAERNLDLFDYVKQHASEEEDRLALEQYRPFVIGHRVRASVLQSLELGAHDEALRDIEDGIHEIQTFFKKFDRPDLVEESEEITFLKEWATEIKKDRPRSLLQDLKEQLREAVALEDFERAAELRDRLDTLPKH